MKPKENAFGSVCLFVYVIAFQGDKAVHGIAIVQSSKDKGTIIISFWSQLISAFHFPTGFFSTKFLLQSSRNSYELDKIQLLNFSIIEFIESLMFKVTCTLKLQMY